MPREAGSRDGNRQIYTNVSLDTFVQWIRRRASANLPLNSHSL